jgi:hypothetical protein
MTSPSFPSSSVGNASVHIQPKAPNTIQYLPANPPPNAPPPSTMGGQPPSKRSASDLEMMARYGSPMDPMNMKGNPSSTLQYFPSSPPNHTMRPHPTPSNGPMPDFPPQASMEMQQAMMMRGGPQDYMGPMGPQPMHPGMGMGPGGPVPSSMAMDMGSMSSGLGSPHMDAMMMGPGPQAMRQVTALGPGGSGAMDPSMSPMMGPGGAGGGGPQPGYPGGGPPSGYMPNGQSMMMGQGPMSGLQGPGSMGSMPMSHGGMPRMPAGPGMRMGGMPGPGGGYPPGAGGYQQFQQQLYTSGRPRPMGPMMGGPGPGQYGMGMMPPGMPGGPS